MDGCSDGAACFSRQSAYACKLRDDTVVPQEAYEQCFGPEVYGDQSGLATTSNSQPSHCYEGACGRKGVDVAVAVSTISTASPPNIPSSSTARQAKVDSAWRVPMSTLRAGDVVLDSNSTATRVIVNQHVVQHGDAAVLLTLHHTSGSLELTPDHLLWIDGSLTPARFARNGSRLSTGDQVVRVTHGRGGVVNPLTLSGRLLASAATGTAVIAATGTEWLADVLLSPQPQRTLAYAVALRWPEAAQAYHDAVLEPMLEALLPYLAALKHRIPNSSVSSFASGLLCILDLGVVLGFLAYALSIHWLLIVLSVTLLGLVSSVASVQARLSFVRAKTPSNATGKSVTVASQYVTATGQSGLAVPRKARTLTSFPSSSLVM